MGQGANRAAPEAETARLLAVFPAPGDEETTSLLYEDDGVTKAGKWCLSHLVLHSTHDHIRLTTRREGDGAPVLPEAQVVLPAGERRILKTATRIDL